ncbi:hypothetical protein HMPREF1548_05259 [Clostridium sp. KLE 1755]|nr:hypothetical protein HMPREF1548_05259 [Clostridium sp. KLE 1755]
MSFLFSISASFFKKNCLSPQAYSAYHSGTGSVLNSYKRFLRNGK